MFETLLEYLNYYPNFLRLVPTGWWVGLAILAAWKGLVSLNIARQTRLRSYVWGGLAGFLATVGFATAPLGHTLLQLVMCPAPMLVAAFVVASLADARSWFSDEGGDKYWIIRHPSLPLQLWGQVPADFQRTPSEPATRKQGLVVCVSTLIFMGFAYAGSLRAAATAAEYKHGTLAAFSPRAMLLISIAVGMAMFHAVMLGLFGAIHGTSTPRRESTPVTEDSE
jgi:hypothetical protein